MAILHGREPEPTDPWYGKRDLNGDTYAEHMAKFNEREARREESVLRTGCCGSTVPNRIHHPSCVNRGQ